MKHFLIIATVLYVGAVGSVSAEPPASPQSAQQTLQLMKDIQAQQAAIAENQAKIDAKIAALGEQIQVAKVFASRAGR